MSNTRELSQLASVITVDDITKNVGVGSTNAQYKLDVEGDINFSGSLYQNKLSYTTQILGIIMVKLMVAHQH